MDIVRNNSKSVSPSEYCNVYGSRVEQAVDAFMDRLGGRLGELEVELRYAWRAVDLLSQEYVKMWEKLERLEILLYEQQNVITQLMAVIKNSGEDPEEYLSSVSDPTLKERLLLKHGVSSDLSDSDILGAFGTSEDSKYPGFQYSSKYMDPSTASETSEWEGTSQSSPGYFHPDLLQYPRREIFTASDYKRYRGASPCISERDLEELDRLSANLHKASTTTTSTPAREVYRTLSNIRNSPLRKRDHGVLSEDSASSFDPDNVSQYKLSAYDEYAKTSGLVTDAHSLDLSTDNLRFTSDSATSAKGSDDLRDSYANIGSWSESSASPKRSLGMGYYSQPPIVVAPVPPDRSISEPSNYTDVNYLGHTVEERQKGHALTPVTEISPEYATSDTAGNGESRSPESLQKLDIVSNVTTSPMSPADPSKTVTAEVHLTDKSRISGDSPCPESPLKTSRKEQSQFHNTATNSVQKNRPRRGKELPQIPYQPCRLKKSELLTRTEPIYQKGSTNTFPPPRGQKQSKSSSPAPGRRKLPQPYIDKSGKITYDRSQGVKPATSIPDTQTLLQQKQFESVPLQASDLQNTSVEFDSGQTSGAQKTPMQPHKAESHQYENVNVTELSPEQNDNAKYTPENQQAYNYDKVQNEPYYVQDTTDDQTYQELPSEPIDKQYSSNYYQDTDNPPYVAETYIQHNVDYQNSSYVDQPAESADMSYDWNSQPEQNWDDSQQTSSEYRYDEEMNVDTSQQPEYLQSQPDEYGSDAYGENSEGYSEPQYAEAYQEHPYGDYASQAEYSNEQDYQQVGYDYATEGQQDNYGYKTEVQHEDYPGYQDHQSAGEQPPANYYGNEDVMYQEDVGQQQVERSMIPPEKPLREHERAAKSERFTASPQHKGYSPQRSSKRRRQRQYSDPVTLSNTMLIQTQVTSSGTITQSTKELSSSATSVAEDTSTAGGGGIFSVLSSKVSKGYKMMSMPTLTKKDTVAPAATTSTTSGSKSGSMTSLFNIGSTLDSFKLGSRSKSRSDSVKSESELSVYDEPQADIPASYPQEEPQAPPPPVRDAYSEQQPSVEEDHDVFYGTEDAQEDPYASKPDIHESEYQDRRETDYQEEEYQDTSEYPDDYYETQEVAEEEEELPSSERTVTFAEESKAEEQKRKKSIATEEFASLFQTVSKVRNPPRQPEDSTESGVLTASVSNESAFFSCVSDSRQSSIAQSEYGSLGSMESVVPNDRDGAKQDGGSLESYGDRGLQDGSEEVQQPQVKEEPVEEGEGTAKKGKKVQFESRSPSGGEEEAGAGDDAIDEDKSKKAIGSTKSKWMKLAVRTSFLFTPFYQMTFNISVLVRFLLSSFFACV
ncbi:hypothetical protein AVEN_141384-1 [Araneus ventricosus]|uniref:Uncharacterized protein n=1 Tax=Araneus ventricosus TaxID=182803 RepID=A0A4Y2D0G0_ARAVE|nr:hypothetical protein AVEN_141384-1 [Araneus ventricosus]